jgi:hypothetical protein
MWPRFVTALLTREMSKRRPLQLFVTTSVVRAIGSGGTALGELTRGERLQIMLTHEELKALDDWRFSARMPSRAAAIRELLKRGLTAEGFITAEQGAKSRDYGVIVDGAASDESAVE